MAAEFRSEALARLGARGLRLPQLLARVMLLALGMPVLSLDIWSDVACPWCYIGKRRIEAALVQFPHRDAVRVKWRSFELNPMAPREPDHEGYAARLARKYGASLREAEAMIERVADSAKAEGLEFDFRGIRPSNTFDAHRLLHLANEQGVQDSMQERLFRAYFCEGGAMSHHETLERLAGEVGLDAAGVSEMLRTGRYAREVRSDQRKAQELGIRAVPCFVFAERFGLSGAQSPEILLRALNQAWQDTLAVRFSEGAACEPDGC